MMPLASNSHPAHLFASAETSIMQWESGLRQRWVREVRQCGNLPSDSVRELAVFNLAVANYPAYGLLVSSSKAVLWAQLSAVSIQQKEQEEAIGSSYAPIYSCRVLRQELPGLSSARQAQFQEGQPCNLR